MPSRTSVVSVTTAAVLALAACAPAQESAPAPATGSAAATPSASTATPSGSGDTATTAPSEAGRVPLTVEITVTGRSIRPAPRRIEVSPGEPLRLVVTVDHDDVLHAHGFEVEKPLESRTPTTIPLTAPEPGLYDIELHDPELRILQVLVR